MSLSTFLCYLAEKNEIISKSTHEHVKVGDDFLPTTAAKYFDKLNRIKKVSPPPNSADTVAALDSEIPILFRVQPSSSRRRRAVTSTIIVKDKNKSNGMQPLWRVVQSGFRPGSINHFWKPLKEPPEIRLGGASEGERG